jgi:predicted Rossmann fold flavoprotein
MYTQRTANPDARRVAVIGGGAAGLMAAGRLAELGADVTLYEKTQRLGTKLRITGKGRCNLTNNCDIQEFISNVPTNPRFLYAALNSFSPEDTMEFFEGLGVPLKTERGKRVFPVSDKAQDIVSALVKYAQHNTRIIHERVRDIIVENGAVKAVLANNEKDCDAVVVCTGGMSYPKTGSDGDGYRLAQKLGHSIVPITPSLVPLICRGNVCAELQGLSLKNVAARFVHIPSGRVIYEDFGEMIFTHNGVSGPMILSGSAHLKNIEISECELVLDLKPALAEQTLDKRLLSDFEKYSNRDFINALGDLLPSKLIEPFVRVCGIEPHTKVNSVTREQRKAVLSILKGFSLPLRSYGPIEEAIVTSGGVKVSEVSPKTMESKIVSGLYFAGEVLDLDAYTGGFNLQIAFSTARLAAENAAY